MCQQARQRQASHSEPSAAILDRQSVKTTEEKGPIATTPAKLIAGIGVRYRDGYGID